jgi:hypothetical protein
MSIVYHDGLLFIAMHGKPQRLRVNGGARVSDTIRCLVKRWARN